MQLLTKQSIILRHITYICNYPKIHPIQSDGKLVTNHVWRPASDRTLFNVVDTSLAVDIANVVLNHAGGAFDSVRRLGDQHLGQRRQCCICWSCGACGGGGPALWGHRRHRSWPGQWVQVCVLWGLSLSMLVDTEAPSMLLARGHRHILAALLEKINENKEGDHRRSQEPTWQIPVAVHVLKCANNAPVHSWALPPTKRTWGG